MTGHLSQADGLDLPDPDDRHVLAAAIHTNAEVIVTFNLHDFPPDALDRYGIEAEHQQTLPTDGHLVTLRVQSRGRR